MPKLIKKESIVNRMSTWFTGLFRSARTLLFGIGNLSVPPPITATTAIDEGFNGTAAVYAILMKDANKFASIPRYVFDSKKLQKRRRLPELLQKSYSEDAIVQNDLSKLLERPNPDYGQATFFKLARAYYKVCGECFIWLNRGDYDPKLDDSKINLLPIFGMYVIPSQYVSIVPKGTDMSELWAAGGYLFTVSGVPIPIRKADIIHWKDVNLKFNGITRDHMRGMSALEPGTYTLSTIKEQDKATLRMAQNDGSRGILYRKAEQSELTVDQEAQIRSVVDSKVNNNNLKGAIATVMGVGELGLVDLSKTANDLQLLEGKQLGWKELCFLFDVPYELFDSNTTFANKEQAQKNWISNSIIPANREFDDELNRVLLRAFALEDRYIIACDHSELPEMQEDMARLTDWLMKATWLTDNEKREMQGYEKYADPLADEMWKEGRPLSQWNDGFDQMIADIQAVGQQGISSNGNGIKK